MRNRIYLDNAATTPLAPEVLEEMIPYMTECCGNPSSVHATGREARRALEAARERTAKALGAEKQEIYFTSGGSESDNWAVLGAALAGKGRHVITSAVEHHAVLYPCRWLEKQGCEVTYLPVDGRGRVDPGDAERAVRSDTALISIMTANNEIGTLEPVGEIGAMARERGILFHTDAVQAVGAVPLDLKEMPVDLMSVSAHKFNGPRGIGLLYIRQGTRIDPLIRGGAQERGMRAGTENTAGAVGLAAALGEAVRDIGAKTERIRRLRDLLITGVLAEIPEARLNGDPVNRLPGNVHFSFPGIDGEALLLRMDLAGIACSGGSACTSGSPEVSHVLTALGQDPETARSGLRMTLSGRTTEAEIRETLRVLIPVVRELRGDRR